MHADVKVFDRSEAASRAGAESFAELARRAVAEHGRFSAALSGGDTPRAMYRMVADSPLCERIPWDHVHLFWGDERAVPPEHPRSNFKMAYEALISRVPIPPANVHRMRGELLATRAAQAYEEELRAHFSEPVPRFDLVHLGIGDDGHTASLFPDAPELAIDDRAVVASFDRAQDEPRITLTFPVIDAADHVEFLVLEPEKARVVAEVLAGGERGGRYPAHRVAPRGRLVWLLTEPAARMLPRTESRQ